MSETRDAFGPLLTQLQVEMRTMRTEMRSLKAEVKSGEASVLAYIGARAAETETMVEANFQDIGRLFGLLNGRLDQTERSVEERLSRIETIITTGH